MKCILQIVINVILFFFLINLWKFHKRIEDQLLRVERLSQSEISVDARKD
jgi:hypothetical protein